MKSGRNTAANEESSGDSSLRWRKFGWIGLLALTASLLASCADSDSDRRFANDPLPTEDLSARPTVPLTSFVPEPTKPPATPATTEQLLSIVGMPPLIFVTRGNRILAVPADGGKVTTVFDAKKRSIVTQTGSPNGEFVAVLVAEDGKSPPSLFLIDLAGKEVAKAEFPVGAGSPIPGGGGANRLSWSSKSDRLLISLTTGGIYEVDADGSKRTILEPSRATSPRAVAWSPTGSAIAFVDAGPNGTATGLYVASIDALPVDPVEVIRPIEGRSRQIVDIQWASAGGIFYLERAVNGDLSIGGDLFEVLPSGGAPRLIASAAGVAQASAIGEFEVSADATAVVYTVIVPGPGGPVTHSLHLSQIGGPTSAGLTIRGGYIIDELTWTTLGLSWSAHVVAGDDHWIVVQLAHPDGQVTTLYSDQPKGTPVASPAVPGSPVASRAESPIKPPG